MCAVAVVISPESARHRDVYVIALAAPEGEVAVEAEGAFETEEATVVYMWATSLSVPVGKS